MTPGLERQGADAAAARVTGIGSLRRALPGAGRADELWRHLDGARRLLAAGIVVSLVGFAALGTWVAHKLEEGIVQGAAESTSRSIGHLISPHLQELASKEILSETAIEALDRLIESAAAGTGLVALKIWQREGRLAYNTSRDGEGRQAAPEDGLKRAWTGVVAAALAEPDDEHGASRGAAGLPVLRIYAPVRASADGKVIAVAELHGRADHLGDHIRDARWQGWLVGGVVATAATGALLAIVGRGSGTVDGHRRALGGGPRHHAALLRQNEVLRRRVEATERLAGENAERLLRRIGADLHDGPAQLVSLALLHLGSDQPAPAERRSALIASVLSEALNDIRNLCAGLLLPKLDERTLEETLRFTIQQHERRTLTRVSFDCADLPADAPSCTKVVLCRFVQEGLTNAFRHAAGIGQRVSAGWNDGALSVEVQDSGPGMQEPASRDAMAMGLIGLRGRIESIGGSLAVSSTPHGGTRLRAQLPLSQEA